MIIAFSKRFYKDIECMDATVKSDIKQVIIEIEAAITLEDIKSIKRMKGSTNAYRIRIGNYRLGFYYIEGAVILTRFLHRKDIYKYFP